MSKKVTLNCKVVIDGYDFANCARGVTLTGDAELIDVSGFGDSSRVYLKSMSSWSLSIEFLDDFADNQLNEKLFAWWQSVSPITAAIRVEDTTIAADNPEFQGSVLTSNIPLFTASFGAASGGTLNLQGSGTLTRAVSA